MADQQQPTQPEKKIVWIACRATEGCTGNQAEIVFARVNQSSLPGGGFVPVMGGKSIRYRCLTCNRPFHVSQ
jgi:hypothetical protein